MVTRPHSRTEGFTLLEVLVAISVLAVLSMLLYGAFAGLKRTKEGVERINDRHREARMAMARMVRELQSTYLSAHEPVPPTRPVQKTVFKGIAGIPGDRIDFVAFAHRRLDRDARESDQSEISYYVASNPDKPGVVDLLRRESALIDLIPEHGGRLEVLATDVDLFDVAFLEPLTIQWLESWDSTQATGQLGRLPTQVRITLVLNGGRRSARGRAQAPIRLITKVALPIQRALTFATQ
jgi:general secretion pathway protein J